MLILLLQKLEKCHKRRGRGKHTFTENGEMLKDKGGREGGRGMLKNQGEIFRGRCQGGFDL